ncbi:hypothetical protein O181_099425 [Austropuccinia psidii MF-1]|uniref:Uncharacterized protein n=1 Tax=Austropuccinia psidii MF-1 TaxID=1389203 RepID=A0A9Q3JAZ4_9BASI|nr:hypothetical protein [Austropuccinia psidii MF-1]
MCHSEADKTVLPSKRADTTTRSCSGHLPSQPEGLQQCIAAQRVPDPCRSVEKLHEFLPDCEKIPGPSQHLQGTQWMASIDGKEEHDAFSSRMQEEQPSTTQESANNSSNSNVKKKPQAWNKVKGKELVKKHTDRATESQRFRRMPWKMCFRWPELCWNYRKRRKPY